MTLLHSDGRSAVLHHELAVVEVLVAWGAPRADAQTVFRNPEEKMVSLEPFTLAKRDDGGVDVVFKNGPGLSFRNEKSFRHVFHKRGLSDETLDEVIASGRFNRPGVGYCDDAEKTEFRELATLVRQRLGSWPAFRETLSLSSSIDPRRLVEEGGTKTHLVILRRAAMKILGDRQVQEIRDEIMKARSTGDAPMEAETEERTLNEEREEAGRRRSAPAAAERNKGKAWGAAAKDWSDKISLREDLPVIEGRKGISNSTERERAETEKIQLFLTERYGLDKSDIGRLAGYRVGATNFDATKGIPRQRLDLLKVNVKKLYKLDVDADVLQGETTRYHTAMPTAPKAERKAIAAGMKPGKNGKGGHGKGKRGAPPADDGLGFDGLFASGSEKLRGSLDDFRHAQSKLRGIMAKAMNPLIEAVELAIAQMDDEPSQGTR